MVVKRKPGETDAGLIGRFRKRVIEEQVIQEAREHEWYEKPAVRRQRKKQEIKHRIELERKREAR